MSGQSIATHTINFAGKINTFSLGNEWSPNLIVLALVDKIVIGVVQFPEEHDAECLDWKEIKELHHPGRCESISISPETSLAAKQLIFAAIGADFNIRIFNSDLNGTDTVQILSGHRSYINSVAWDYENEYLASGSDDRTCILWKIKDNFKQDLVFYFNTAIMTVKFHPDESDKLLVAEKGGIIHLYTISEQQVFLSVDTSRSPLMSADWSVSNATFVCAVAAGETFIWDLKSPSRAVEMKQIHEDVGQMIKFSPYNELIAASVGRPGTTLKIMHCKGQVPQVEASLVLFGGLDWHPRLPYVAVAQDRKLCFWKILIT